MSVAADVSRVNGRHRNHALAAARVARAVQLLTEGQTYQAVADGVDKQFLLLLLGGGDEDAALVVVASDGVPAGATTTATSPTTKAPSTAISRRTSHEPINPSDEQAMARHLGLSKDDALLCTSPANDYRLATPGDSPVKRVQ